MRLFWKLFCSMVTITALACAIGGFVLIDGQFRAGLDAQAELVTTENTLLRRTLLRQMQFSRTFTQEEAARLAGEASSSESRDSVRFRLSDGGGNVLAGHRLSAESSLVSSLSENEAGWEVLRAGDHLYLHAAAPVALEDGTVYLENWREVGNLFALRKTQYTVFFYVLLGLLLATALAALALSAWMTRPLGQLSEAARQVAGGALERRVEVRGDDEIACLGRDFNQMAAQLERHVSELTDHARRQEEFLHSFAHETKTPLTAIIGYGELLLSRPEDPVLVRESAGYIFREGRRLESLSRKLLDMFVLEQNGVNLRQTELSSFLEETAGALRPALERDGIHLEVRAQPGTAPIEPDLMASVCLNLLDNARKAVSRGGHILVEGTPSEDGYTISVTDDGRGIAPEDLGRITEPFYMADKSRARAQGGAGLGLTVCQRIVALHGAALKFDSAPGRGTRVQVHLKGGASH